MRLYFQLFSSLFKKFILRQSTGQVICDFAENMGVVYIKMAQILAMQNFGKHFTESDRQRLAVICDQCQPIDFAKIKTQIEAEYDAPISDIFQEIDPQPLGSASISQVHRAVLLDGRVVAVKVKRQDITRRIQHDIRQLRRLIHRLSKFSSLKNLLGSDQALELWATWIEQETDFVHERENLTHYREFADSVNGKIPGTTQIQVPNLCPELCTENIIVMDFVDSPTVNHIPLTPANKQRISTALNDYISLSFWGLLHDQPVTFHGDPHGGNIYIDAAGNLGFLDFGLTFAFTAAEADFVRHLFLYAYNAKIDPLIELLLRDSEYTEYDHEAFERDVREQAERFQEIPVTQFFIEMINVFTRYNIAPPTILFKAAKAFLALFGINNFIENRTTTKELLMTQIAEFYLQRTVNEVKSIFDNGWQILPDFLEQSSKSGLISALAAELPHFQNIHREAKVFCEHCAEALEFVGLQPE